MMIIEFPLLEKNMWEIVSKNPVISFTRANFVNSHIDMPQPIAAARNCPHGEKAIAAISLTGTIPSSSCFSIFHKVNSLFLHKVAAWLLSGEIRIADIEFLYHWAFFDWIKHFKLKLLILSFDPAEIKYLPQGEKQSVSILWPNFLKTLISFHFIKLHILILEFLSQ
ncbi:unnamed protein product [Blepharisma stoltei]|uniref:Uncharacterized protein n=1 Tax=Blepharisma stoltei TaxID=1481888 RepID=A0AAU9JHD2_9CILI|nr:unnamed protein product [Blepharisma stoltei]